MSAPPRALVPMFAAMALSLLVAELDQSVVGTALPTILGDLGGAARLQWINTAYVAAATLAMPAYGVLGDRFGRRPLLLVALGLLVSGSVIGGCAGTVGALVLGRAVQGLGGGGMLIMVQAAVADAIPARERQAWMSALGVVFAVAAIGGPALGGWLAQDVGWRWIFWMNLPLGGLAMAAVAVLLPRGGGGQGSRRRAVRETTALLARPAVALPIVAGAVLGLTVFGVIGYLPTYVQMSLGLSPTRAGLFMLTLASGIGVATVLSAQFVRRTGRYRGLPVLGCAVAALALVALAYAGQAGSLRGTGASLLLLGVGIGCAWEVLVVMVQNASPAERVGAATAANGFVREAGVSAGVALAGLLISSRLGDLFAHRLPAAAGAADLHRLTPARLAAADAGTRGAVASIYRDAFFPVLLAGAPLLLLMAGLMLLVPTRPLARTIDQPADERVGAEVGAR